jgi:hypothetical protein
VLYVEELIGPETVNTMPEETIEPSRTTARWRSRSSATSTRRSGLRRGRRGGVDYDDVVVDARARGRREVRRLVPGAARRRQAKRGELVSA